FHPAKIRRSRIVRIVEQPTGATRRVWLCGAEPALSDRPLGGSRMGALARRLLRGSGGLDILVRAGVVAEVWARSKRFLPCRGLIPHRAGNQPYDRVNDHSRPQLTAAQNVVANRNFAISEKHSNPLVHALVAPADQDQTLELC